MIVYQDDTVRVIVCQGDSIIRVEFHQDDTVSGWHNVGMTLSRRSAL